MSTPIVDPPTPYMGLIPGGFFPGKMVRIQGIVPMHGERFDVNLQTGPNGEDGEEDVALHISVRLREGYIARNSFQSGCWQDEAGDGGLPINPGQRFEILILCESYEYKIAINGQHFTSFPLRVPFNRVGYIMMRGDVKLTLVSWEGSGASAPPGGPINGPPQYGTPGGPPPQYAPPGSAPGYGQQPPQAGQETTKEETMFNQLKDSTKTAIVSNIAKAASDKLLESISSSKTYDQSHPGGHDPNKAQYGLYPELPQQQQQLQQESSTGGLGSLLLNALTEQVLHQTTPTKTLENTPQQNVYQPQNLTHVETGQSSGSALGDAGKVLINSIIDQALRQSPKKNNDNQSYSPQQNMYQPQNIPQTQTGGQSSGIDLSGVGKTLLNSMIDQALQPAPAKNYNNASYSPQQSAYQPQNIPQAKPGEQSSGIDLSGMGKTFINSIIDQTLQPSSAKNYDNTSYATQQNIYQPQNIPPGQTGGQASGVDLSGVGKSLINSFIDQAFQPSAAKGQDTSKYSPQQQQQQQRFTNESNFAQAPNPNQSSGSDELANIGSLFINSLADKMLNPTTPATHAGQH